MEVEESKLIEQKKLQSCIIVWIGIIMVPIGTFFYLFYIKKNDVINFDSYAIMEDADGLNIRYSMNPASFAYGYSFTVDNKIIKPFLIEYSRPKNYMFVPILHTLLFIKRGRRNENEYTFNMSVNFPKENTHVYQISIEGGGTKDIVSIPVKMKRIIPNPKDNNAFTMEYAKRIDFVAIRNPELRNADPTLKETVVLDKVHYKEDIVEPEYVEIVIKDASSMKVDYNFPAQEGLTISVLCLFFLFLSLFLIFVFAWYWWSVKYKIIEDFICRNIPNQKWY